MLTVDANIFVSASAPTDVFHVDSDTFLDRVLQAGIPVLCPALVLPETASELYGLQETYSPLRQLLPASGHSPTSRCFR